MKMSRQSSHSGVLMKPVAVSIPAVKSSESPGRKNPMSSPVSMKTIARMPTTASGPNQVMIVSGSSHSGPRAGTPVLRVRGMAAMLTGGALRSLGRDRGRRAK